MAASGINAVRTYSVPPVWFLDIAQRYRLQVMVGLCAEQHVGAWIDGCGAVDIPELVRRQIRDFASHPAILCYALANEIPASTVRWLGPRCVEKYLRELCEAVKMEDSLALVTYVNYPSTEYLQLPFLDLICFNVYLESQERFEAYLARLQNLAGQRPLLMGEIGLDSIRNGEAKQAAALKWQIHSAFNAGCAGAFVYSWTDEWFRGGAEVEDWAFGLTGKDRHAKPALAAVRDAFQKTPFDREMDWPFMSVVLCTRNGSRTIEQTLQGLARLDYPNFEVIVVDDGSTDETPAILARCNFRVIRTPNGGLSAARNIGMRAARGEIVAYIDDDAYPDPHWLSYLALVYIHTNHAGVGGPNLAPCGDGAIADSVASAPGGPVHVLLSDTEAEHIPGCNASFRRDALLRVDGWDPRFRIAGDDVDLCWRLQAAGATIGFSPAALVWHHRRNSVRAYWRQQLNYGKAEALLEQKWPEKYNPAGHLAWRGRIYGNGSTFMLAGTGRIYHGVWGSAPFQLLYAPHCGFWRAIPSMPEWYLLIAVLAGLSALGALWKPLLFFMPAIMVSVAISLVQAARGAANATFPTEHPSAWFRFLLRVVTAYLYVLQPLARLLGRFSYGLTLWRRRSHSRIAVPWPHVWSVWTKSRDPLDRLKGLEEKLRASRVFTSVGREYDRWDLQAKTGLLGGARLLTAVEEHRGGRQLLRFRAWPVFSLAGPVMAALFACLALAAKFDHAVIPAGVLGLAGLLAALRTAWECMSSQAAIVDAVRQMWERKEES
jgi:glycosyltransferase involved in cell wall biosynthesis